MTKQLTPIQSIKKYCRYDCCANELESWKHCTRPNCPLFQFRLGKRSSKHDSAQKQADLPLNSEKDSVLEGDSD